MKRERDLWLPVHALVLLALGLPLLIVAALLSAAMAVDDV